MDTGKTVSRYCYCYDYYFYYYFYCRRTPLGVLSEWTRERIPTRRVRAAGCCSRQTLFRVPRYATRVRYAVLDRAFGGPCRYVWVLLPNPTAVCVTVSVSRRRSSRRGRFTSPPRPLAVFTSENVESNERTGTQSSRHVRKNLIVIRIKCRVQGWGRVTR